MLETGGAGVRRGVIERRLTGASSGGIRAGVTGPGDATLKVPLTAAQLDAVLARADRAGLSHLEFAHALLAEQTQQRRERAIAHRIKGACFRDPYTLADFDWNFNAKAINRAHRAATKKTTATK